jgi:hypothetical protein
LTISSAYLSHPYGISVFENSVYWTEWNYKTLNSAEKWRGGQELTLLTALPVTPYDVKIVHPLRDPEGELLRGLGKMLAPDELSMSGHLKELTMHLRSSM